MLLVFIKYKFGGFVSLFLLYVYVMMCYMLYCIVDVVNLFLKEYLLCYVFFVILN